MYWHAAAAAAADDDDSDGDGDGGALQAHHGCHHYSGDSRFVLARQTDSSTEYTVERCTHTDVWSPVLELWKTECSQIYDLGQRANFKAKPVSKSQPKILRPDGFQKGQIWIIWLWKRPNGMAVPVAVLEHLAELSITDGWAWFVCVYIPVSVCLSVCSLTSSVTPSPDVSVGDGDSCFPFVPWESHRNGNVIKKWCNSVMGTLL